MRELVWMNVEVWMVVIGWTRILFCGGTSWTDAHVKKRVAKATTWLDDVATHPTSYVSSRVEQKRSNYFLGSCQYVRASQRITA